MSSAVLALSPYKWSVRMCKTIAPIRDSVARRLRFCARERSLAAPLGISVLLRLDHIPLFIVGPNPFAPFPRLPIIATVTVGT
jgi:hypothetical protein